MAIHNTVVYDLHSHILPKMDDGSKSSAESIQMLKELAAQGIESVVATPHFYPWSDEPEFFFDRRTASYARLREAIEESGVKNIPTVHIGAEVAFFRGLANYRDLSKLCIMGTEYILIEMPFEKWTGLMIDEVVSIKSDRSVTPIIVHIERYLPFMDESMLDELIANGCIIQGNTSPLLKFFERRRVIDLIKKEKIHVLGSDCHNMTTRAPNMSDASRVLNERIGEGAVSAFNANAREILKNAWDLPRIVGEEK